MNEEPVIKSVPPAYSVPLPPKRAHSWIYPAVLIGVIVLLLAAGAWYYFVYRVDVQYRAVQSAFNNNDFAGALQKADAILASNPKDAQALIFKSLILSQEGSLQFREKELGGEAVSAAQLAITADPKNSEAYRALGYAYEIQQDYPNAHANYQKAVSLDPKNAKAAFDDAHAYDLQGEIEKAEAGYRAAIALNATLDAPHAGLARMLLSKNDTDGAITEYNQAYTLTKNTHNKAEYAYSLGQLLAQKGDLANAAQYATAATTLDPNYPLGWYGLGKVQVMQSDPKASADKTTADRLVLLQAGLNNLAKAISLNKYQTVAYVEIANVQVSILAQKDGATKNLVVAEYVLPLDITLNASDKERVQGDITKIKEAIASKK
ncbi:MAG: tetratricopeptide repeat protein [Parcubacteria group bacterium]|nr:tetratricopeptide repeat protein [Parcubacteria group bacterium]